MFDPATAYETSDGDDGPPVAYRRRTDLTHKRPGPGRDPRAGAFDQITNGINAMLHDDGGGGQCPPKPAALAPDFAAIPPAMRDALRWVLWAYCWVADRGGWQKVPLRTDGDRAKSTDLSTWNDFGTAAGAYRADPGVFAGVGFVLGDGWAGVDLDDVRDPNTGDLLPWAGGLVAAVSTYAEVSPSGTGVKLFGRAEWHGAGKKRSHPHGGSFEVYSGGRYFTVTGAALPGRPKDIGDIGGGIRELLALAKQIDAGNGSVSPPHTDARNAPNRPPVADVLAEIGERADLWHDVNGSAFASLGRQTLPVESRAFRKYLIAEYRKATSKVPDGGALSNAIEAIGATAVNGRPERAAYTRVAGHDGKVYLHLADDDDTVIEIDAGGWRECPEPPVRFVRKPGIKPLPRPERGGSVGDLRRFVNVASDADFALVVACLTMSFHPAGPYPLLVLNGGQGSAKTTTARVLRALIDPNASPTRAEPKDAQNLAVAAANAWVLCFDNLSGLSGSLSDALCRLSTGGAHAARRLYSDADEAVLDAKRPVILTGIGQIIVRGDLSERSVVLRLPAIPDGRRKSERDFWADFEAARPKLLGALLDRLCGAIRALPCVRLDARPRMADFAEWSVAAEIGACGTGELFLAAYTVAQGDASEQALDADPTAAALMRLMDGRSEWRGSATELLAALRPLAAGAIPKAPNTLSGELERLAPDLLRAHGLAVRREREPGRSRARIIRITREAAERTPDAGGGFPAGGGVEGNPAASGMGVITAADDPSGHAGRLPAEGSSAENDGEVKPADGADGADDLSPIFYPMAAWQVPPPPFSSPSQDVGVTSSASSALAESACKTSAEQRTIPAGWDRPRPSAPSAPSGQVGPRRFGNNPHRGTALDAEGGRP